MDGIFEGNQAQVEEYQQRLASLAVDRAGLPLLPELYYVPAVNIEAEKLNPRSQQRLPTENVPLVWAQSLYFLGQLLNEGLIAVGDIDPLGRHLSVGRHGERLVQIALLAEDEDLQAELAANGIAAQTPKQVEPIQVRQTKELSAIYAEIGRNDPLGLTGRPMRRLRSLTTSRVFKIRGEAIVFLPSFLDREEFYLTLDYHFLVSKIQSEIAHIHRHWYQLGRPTVTLMLTHAMLETGPEALLELMKELRDGHCQNTLVKLGNLNQLMLTASTERIDFMHDFEFTESPVTGAVETRSYLNYNPEKTWPLGHTQEFKLECETNTNLLLASLQGSENLYEQIELLHTLIRLKGLNFDTGFGGAEATVQVVDLLNEVYTKAGEGSQSKIQWAVIRYAAGLLDKIDISLSDAVTDILVRQKQIAVGKAYSEDSVISRPGSYMEVMDKIREFCGEDVRDRVLTQEVIIYLGLLIKAEPQLFKGLLTLRVSYFILLLTSELARELGVTQNEAYEQLMQLSPFEIKKRLRQVLTEYEEMNQILKEQESLRVKQQEKDIEWVVASVSEEPQMPGGGWRRKRQMEGAVNRVPKDFYPSVWGLLRHCKGLIIGDKLERRNRLDSDVILSEMTPGEKNFALQIEHLLNKIVAPEYRQVNIEALMELAAIAQRNPELKVEEYIVLDVLVGHAVRLNWLGKNPERADKYDEDKAAAWQGFYNTSPYVCASHVLDAFRFLTTFG